MNLPDIAWTVAERTDDSVVLVAEPVPRVIPDGVRVRVAPFHVTTYRETPRERRAQVHLVDAEGNRGRGSAAGVRFGSTAAHPACSVEAAESTIGYGERQGERYWRGMRTTAWREDGIADDLPEGARGHLRDVLASAAAYAGEHLPELWQGADVAAARRALERAEDDLVASRNAVKTARAALRSAEAKLRRATR